MHLNEQRSGRLDAAASTQQAPSPEQRPQPAAPRVTRLGVPRLAGRRWWVAATWIGGGAALLLIMLRISLSFPANSDGANNALQAWDLLHGHVLLHGWIIGDASYYTFELPLYAIIELFSGLNLIVIHLAGALTYLIVMAFCVVLARTGSHGAAAVARCAVVVAVLAAPLATQQGTSILVELPDHIGTSAFLLGSFLLIDRAPGWRFTPPLLAVILCVAQLGDATVFYVAVPTILLVCAYRIVAAGKIRTSDTAIAVAAAASVPLEKLTWAVIQHLGGFLMISPKTRISPGSQWPGHILMTWRNIRTLYGAFGPTVTGAHAPLTVPASVFGVACLLAAAFGFAKVVARWTTVSRAEQLLCVAIVVNIAAYVVSTMPSILSSREVAAVLPCGAVLAARACVPARIAGARRARVAVASVAVAALLPLAAGVTLPTVTPPAVPLAAWLKAHHLTYGLGGYWAASVVTLQSHNQVQVRTVGRRGNQIAAYYYEARPDWYSPSLHDATFVIIDIPFGSGTLTSAIAEQWFGRPAKIYQVPAAAAQVLVYRTNLLDRLATPDQPGPAS
jgi:hypothetical protein